MAEPLPIHAVLSDLLAALRERNSAVLIAPPGAGKTTAVAPALLGEGWCSGTVILLSPRRVAARAAAERMAELLGEKAGETIGYLTRLDSKRSGRTRVLVMTEAIFVAQVLEDPELAGVSAVLFDEAHERHLDSDLGLALAIESQQVLREDLRIVVMSATIDGARFARLDFEERLVPGLPLAMVQRYDVLQLMLSLARLIEPLGPSAVHAVLSAYAAVDEAQGEALKRFIRRLLPRLARVARIAAWSSRLDGSRELMRLRTVMQGMAAFVETR